MYWLSWVSRLIINVVVKLIMKRDTKIREIIGKGLAQKTEKNEDHTRRNTIKRIAIGPLHIYHTALTFGESKIPGLISLR